MKILAEKLRDIRDQAHRLTSLKPGEGYDALGFALCDIVAQTKMDYAERQAFFAYLDAEHPGLVQDLQQISIWSEVELDRFHAKRILGRLKDQQVIEKISLLPVPERLPEILHEYPHGWIYARTQEVLRLLQNMPDQKALSERRPLYILGRSNLPLDALSFHLMTGCPVIWLDPYSDSADIACDFIEELQAFGLLMQQSITIQSYKILAQEFFDEGHAIALMVLDDALMEAQTFQLAADIKLPVITVDSLGLAQLLYPYSPDRRPESSFFKRQMVVLAQHSHDELITGAILHKSSSADMFLSISLYMALPT